MSWCLLRRIYFHCSKFIDIKMGFVFPTRFCLKMTGPFESILIAIHRIKRIGDNTMIPTKDNKNLSLFLNRLYTLYSPTYSKHLQK